MSRREGPGLGVALAAGAAVLLLGGGVAAAAASGKRRTSSPGPSGRLTVRDIEALARMIASENPRGSKELHIEQIWSQIRSLHPGQSLYELTTAGSGFGPQGRSSQGGKRRPVATDEEATDYGRQVARDVLTGKYDSTLPGARRFFEPAQQDLAFAIGERARAKLARKEPLTKQEQRLSHYKKTAEQVRTDWIHDGHRFVGAIDGVEFYT